MNKLNISDIRQYCARESVGMSSRYFRQNGSGWVMDIAVISWRTRG